MQECKYASILSPNIFDPNLTWPKFFQTERTRRLAHLPSFCELVSSLSSHALLIRLTSLKVQIKLKLNFIFITHRPYWPTHSAGNSSLSQLQGGLTQGDALQLLGLPGHCCKDGLCGDGRYDDGRCGHGHNGRYADGGCGHGRDGEPIAWWILVCIPSFTSCSVDKNLFRSAAVSWDTALAAQALVAHSLANSGKLA